MKVAFARAISYIFNPIVLLLFAPFLLIYKTQNDFNAAVVWTLYTFVFLLILTAFLFICVKKRIFTDLDVSKREQRPLLFLATIILTLLYLFGLVIFHGPQVLMAVVLGVLLGILLVSIINTRIKASIHVATVAALIFAIAVVYGGYYLILLLFIPFIGWARVKVKRHTVPETVVGGILGSLLSLIMYFSVKFFFHG